MSKSRRFIVTRLFIDLIIHLSARLIIGEPMYSRQLLSFCGVREISYRCSFSTLSYGLLANNLLCTFSCNLSGK